MAFSIATWKHFVNVYNYRYSNFLDRHRHGRMVCVARVGTVGCLRRHFVGVAAQPVRAQSRRVRKPLIAPLASQRLVARVRVQVNLYSK